MDPLFEGTLNVIGHTFGCENKGKLECGSTQSSLFFVHIANYTVRYKFQTRVSFDCPMKLFIPNILFCLLFPLLLTKLHFSRLIKSENHKNKISELGQIVSELGEKVSEFGKNVLEVGEKVSGIGKTVSELAKKQAMEVYELEKKHSKEVAALDEKHAIEVSDLGEKVSKLEKKVSGLGK